MSRVLFGFGVPPLEALQDVMAAGMAMGRAAVLRGPVRRKG